MISKKKKIKLVKNMNIPSYPFLYETIKDLAIKHLEVDNEHHFVNDMITIQTFCEMELKFSLIKKDNIIKLLNQVNKILSDYKDINNYNNYLFKLKIIKQYDCLFDPVKINEQLDTDKVKDGTMYSYKKMLNKMYGASNIKDGSFEQKNNLLNRMPHINNPCIPIKYTDYGLPDFENDISIRELTDVNNNPIEVGVGYIHYCKNDAESTETLYERFEFDKLMDDIAEQSAKIVDLYDTKNLESSVNQIRETANKIVELYLNSKY